MSSILYDVQISKNFKLSEFMQSAQAKKYEIKEQSIIPYAYLNNLYYVIMHLLQPARDAIKIPITITSGWRHTKLNERVGGSPTSDHQYGRAADITCADNQTLFNFLKKQKFDQLIRYYNDRIDFIHVSFNAQKNRNQILECYLQADDTGVPRRRFRVLN